MAGTLRVTWNQAGLNETLRSRGGTVGRFTLKTAIQVTDQAKVTVGGSPHGYWKGTMYPQAPGGPPGVRTGQGRRSIMWRPGTPPTVYVGVGAGYMLILERRRVSPYPWLGLILASHGFTVRWF